MPITLDTIPLRQTIVDSAGAINLFFRLRWEQLRARITLTPTVAEISDTGKTSGLATKTIYTTQAGARYLVSWQMKRSVADGAASSLQATIGWTQDGAAMTHVGRLMNTDSTGADPTDSPIMINADQNSAITIAIAYTSTTPAKMTYGYHADVQQLG